MTGESKTSPEPSEPTPTADAGGMFSAPKQDLLASIVVFLVALPLCMGIAIASGVPVAAGLITGIVGGIVVGLLAGAPLQVSGPAAGLTVIVYELVKEHGYEVLGLAVLVGGLLQLIAGLLRYGRWFRAVSPAVIHGMLAGIGVLILASQFHVMVDDAPKGSGLQNLLSIPAAIQKGLPMPTLGSVEERTARRDLLQEFGALHEQQVQLRERISERIPISSEEAGTSATTDHDSAPVSADIKQLEPLAAIQQQLTDRLNELIKQIESTNILNSVRNPEQLNEATRESLKQMQISTSELAAGSAEKIRPTQERIQLSLENILAQLKNHDWAAKIGMLTICLLILWKALIPEKFKLIPAPLVAVVIATALTVFLVLPVLYVEVPDNLWSEIHFPSLVVIQSVSFGVVLQAGIVLAIVASAETLLCATAVDQMQTICRTKYDRELAAQGIGNMICGFLGALPMTGVIVRSSANVDAGGRTRLSAILHGVWLLVFVSLLAFVLRMIPTATLAAMLVYTGYKLINFKAIRELRKCGWGEVGIYLATLSTIVCTDLLTGVLTGIALAAVKLLYTFSHLSTDLKKDPANKRATLHLQGAATFIRLPFLASALDEVPEGYELHVDFQHLSYIDHACLDLLKNWEKQHTKKGGSLVIDWGSLNASFKRPSSQKQPAQQQS